MDADRYMSIKDTPELAWFREVLTQNDDSVSIASAFEIVSRLRSSASGAGTAADAGAPSDADLLVLYRALDEFAREVDSYEYGLPLLGIDGRDETVLLMMRAALRQPARTEAESGRDAVCYRSCDKHMGQPFTLAMACAPSPRFVCPLCEQDAARAQQGERNG